MGCCHEKRSKLRNEGIREGEIDISYKDFKHQPHSIRDRLAIEDYTIMERSNFVNENELSESINAFDEELTNNNNYMIAYCGGQIKELYGRNIDVKKGESVPVPAEMKYKMQESFFSFTNNNPIHR